MTYRSDRQIIEAIVPVRLLYTVVVNGTDLEDAGNEQVRTWLVNAGADVCRGMVVDKAASLSRRAERICREAEMPFRKAEAKVSKFGLCVYHVLAALRDQGFFLIEDGTDLDKAVEALLSPEGSIAEAAGVDAIDASAAKSARKMLAALQAEGLYRGATWP